MYQQQSSKFATMRRNLKVIELKENIKKSEEILQYLKEQRKKYFSACQQ